MQPSHILIVEDESSARKALSVLLSNCGYQTQPFASAEEALESLEDLPRPTVALVDLDLPGMDGLALIERLETLDPSLTAILITATDEERLALRLHDHSIAYLRKPLNFEALLSLLAEKREERSRSAHAKMRPRPSPDA